VNNFEVKEEILKRSNYFFNQCDKDHSGVVSISEFLEWSKDPSFEEFSNLIG